MGEFLAIAGVGSNGRNLVSCDYTAFSHDFLRGYIYPLASVNEVVLLGLEGRNRCVFGVDALAEGDQLGWVVVFDRLTD